uniref:Uncharacterized protein n=1 Tax=Oryza meridionalis TaxID=40149 RepID=A0A0E0F8J9_9ORYZ
MSVDGALRSLAGDNIAVSTAIPTGTTSSLSSANSGLNRSRHGSRHVVPSGHTTTRSPPSRSRAMARPSLSRSRVSRTVRPIGEISSDSRLRLYDTARTGRSSATDTYTGSISVRWLHTNSCPRRRAPSPAPASGAGASPLRRHDKPVAARIGVEYLYGTASATARRATARAAPKGSQVNMASVSPAAGRNARRPSWNTIGFGYLSRGNADHLAFSSRVTRFDKMEGIQQCT